MTELERVEWPDSLDRTSREERRRRQGTNGYCRTIANGILAELDLIGAEKIDLQTNMEHMHDEPNLPAVDGGDPPDPAVVLRFELNGEQCCLAADEGARVKDNLRAIEEYLENQESAHANEIPPQVFETIHVGINRPF